MITPILAILSCLSSSKQFLLSSNTTTQHNFFHYNHIKQFEGEIISNIKKIILGDEILSINGQVLQGMTHGQAISVFKNIKQGPVSLHIARRLQPQLPPFGKRYPTSVIRNNSILQTFFFSFRKFQSQSCEELEILEE